MKLIPKPIVGEYAPYTVMYISPYLITEEGQERVRAADRDNYARLAKVKAKYDPQNLSHLNQNIKPAT